MLKAEIELRIHQFLDDYLAGKTDETSDVEVKSQRPEPNKFAVRLAAFANASRHAPFFFVFGVEEPKGADHKPRFVALDNPPDADWFAKIEKRFDGEAPSPVPGTAGHFSMPHGDGSVYVLYYEAHGPPYVVRPESEDAKDQWKVVVRRETRTLAANREDLVRMVTPIARAPNVELLSATIGTGGMRDLNSSGHKTSSSMAYVALYVGGSATFPAHLARMSVSRGPDGPAKPRFDLKVGIANERRDWIVERAGYIEFVGIITPEVTPAYDTVDFAFSTRTIEGYIFEFVGKLGPPNNDDGATRFQYLWHKLNEDPFYLTVRRIE